MDFDKLKNQLTKVLLHAFMFNKIVNVEEIIDPVTDKRCSFTRKEYEEWENNIPEIQELYYAIIHWNNEPTLQDVLHRIIAGE